MEVKMIAQRETAWFQKAADLHKEKRETEQLQVDE